MPRHTRIVNMSLPADIYSQMEEIAKEKRVSKSQLFKESLKQYLAAENRWRQIRRWGDETARRSGIEDERAVERIIHEFRKEQS